MFELEQHYELKIYRGVMCYEWRKTWKGIDLSVRKWHEKFTNFDTSAQKSQNFAL